MLNQAFSCKGHGDSLIPWSRTSRTSFRFGSYGTDDVQSTNFIDFSIYTIDSAKKASLKYSPHCSAGTSCPKPGSPVPSPSTRTWWPVCRAHRGPARSLSSPSISNARPSVPVRRTRRPRAERTPRRRWPLSPRLRASGSALAEGA